jgi:hypothetical protein
MLSSASSTASTASRSPVRFRDHADDFATLNATVVGISAQDLASHEAFAAKHSLNVPLLADTDKQVAKSPTQELALFSPRVVRPCVKERVCTSDFWLSGLVHARFGVNGLKELAEGKLEPRRATSGALEPCR